MIQRRLVLARLGRLAALAAAGALPVSQTLAAVLNAAINQNALPPAGNNQAANTNTPAANKPTMLPTRGK